MKVAAPWGQRLQSQHLEEHISDEGSHYSKPISKTKRMQILEFQRSRLVWETAERFLTTEPLRSLIPVWPRISDWAHGLLIHSGVSPTGRNTGGRKDIRGWEDSHSFLPHPPTDLIFPYIISLVGYLYFGRISLFQGLSTNSGGDGRWPATQLIWAHIQDNNQLQIDLAPANMGRDAKHLWSPRHVLSILPSLALPIERVYFNHITICLGRNSRFHKHSIYIFRWTTNMNSRAFLFALVNLHQPAFFLLFCFPTSHWNVQVSFQMYMLFPYWPQDLSQEGHRQTPYCNALYAMTTHLRSSSPVIFSEKKIK